MASTAIVVIAAAGGYCSTTSITSRPLYFPQLGQTRCGTFGSWQLGHSARTVRVKESWVRRADVRRLECRRFGLGMGSPAYKLSNLLLQFLQRRPTVVNRFRMAVALIQITIPPAHRADSLAVFPANALHRQRQ